APAPSDAKIFRVLLYNEQSRFTATGEEFYRERVMQALTPDALRLGDIALSWDPATEALVIHRIQVIRDGKTIDVLASGQTLTVLRREPNLDASIMDGRLTAEIQPEGVQVGDIIDVAYTIKHRDPTFQGRGEGEFVLPQGVPMDHVFFRGVWPASLDVKWRETKGLDAALVKKTADGTDVSIDETDVPITYPTSYPPAAV